MTQNKTLIIIPAAGKGSRFQELGKNYPKCILPINNKPIIAHNISNYFSKFGADACEIRVVTSDQGYTVINNLLEMFFPSHIRDGELKVIAYDAEFAKFPGPVASIQAALSNDDKYKDVIISLSDIIVPDNVYVHDMVKSIRGNNYAIGALSTETVEDTSRWCIAWQEDGRTKFCDKPAYFEHKNSLTGVYYFTSHDMFVRATNNSSLEISEILTEYQNLFQENSQFCLLNLRIEDYGTLREYLARRNVSISRSFNKVERISSYLISKSSEQNPEKIIQEAEWYKRLPETVSFFSPRLYKVEPYAKNGAQYTMEFIRAPSAREHMLFLDGSTQTWTDFFDQAFLILKTMSEHKKPGNSNFMLKMVEKTIQRSRQISLSKSQKENVDSFIDVFGNVVNKGFYSKIQDSLYHGDFCFSNILYDTSDGSMKMIDPRGEAYGNIYYDLAKLMHSACYHYDYIDSELYSISDNKVYYYDANHKIVERIFMEKLQKYIGEEEVWKVRMITASLFLSMIPLHSHNKKNQELFYALFEDAYYAATSEWFANGS